MNKQGLEWDCHQYYEMMMLLKPGTASTQSLGRILQRLLRISTSLSL
jgi:hypothetical protein